MEIDPSLMDFYNLLSLAQVLGEQNLTEPLHLSIISNQLQAITGDESLAAEKATLLGPCRVMPQEYAHITCRSIDIEWPPPRHGSNQRLIAQLTAELIADAPDPVVAYRGRHR